MPSTRKPAPTSVPATLDPNTPRRLGSWRRSTAAQAQAMPCSRRQSVRADHAGSCDRLQGAAAHVTKKHAADEGRNRQNCASIPEASIKISRHCKDCERNGGKKSAKPAAAIMGKCEGGITDTCGKHLDQPCRERGGGERDEDIEKGQQENQRRDISLVRIGAPGITGDGERGLDLVAESLGSFRELSLVEGATVERSDRDGADLHPRDSSGRRHTIGVGYAKLGNGTPGDIARGKELGNACRIKLPVAFLRIDHHG